MVKHLAYNMGELGSIPGSGKSSGEGNGNPLQYSCLENPMDRGAWWATVHEVIKSLKQPSTQRSTATDEDYSRPCWPLVALLILKHSESCGTDFTGNDNSPFIQLPTANSESC